MNRTERQRARLKSLIESVGGQDQLAEMVGTAPSYISQLMNSRDGIAQKFCERIEAATGRPDGWLDQWLHDETEMAGMSETEIRILGMWRSWNPTVKQYVFGQMKIANFTKDILPAMFTLNSPITEAEINRLVVDSVSETGEFTKLTLSSDGADEVPKG